VFVEASRTIDEYVLRVTVQLPHLYAGKVREMYDAGDGNLLIVASDRLSAFDVVMNEQVPNKGRVLTAISAFWFDHLADIAPNHLISTDIDDFPDGAKDPELAGRSMYVRKAEMLPIECIVRGYITGSAWKEYSRSGTMHGTALPEDMLESQQLPEPVFTPSTKAEDGLHDENISFEQAVDLVGIDIAEQARDLSIALYKAGAEWAAERGIIIADTKFELGMVNGELVVADEMLTPDSSRFWPANQWVPGTTPPSFDKQPVRDFLDTLDWDKTPPPPTIPDEVISATIERYTEGYERITGMTFADWPGVTNR
jgi:phosphoribosylaminoimidazole-succinocarboxamide synthase